MIFFFGTPAIVIAKLWELIVENNGGGEERFSMEHLLWALHYLENAPNISVMCTTIKRNGEDCPWKRTALKWIWFYVNELAALEQRVIVWEHRKTNDRGDDCLVSVDCTDCPFQQILIDNPDKPGKKMINKALYSFKLEGPGLRYEIA